MGRKMGIEARGACLGDLLAMLCHVLLVSMLLPGPRGLPLESQTTGFT